MKLNDLISRVIFTGAIVSVLWTGVAAAQQLEPTSEADVPLTITIDEKSPALHFPIGEAIIQIEPAFEDYAFMMFDVCDAMEMSGTDCIIFPMNGSLGGNAIASVFDDNQIIIYDRELSKIVGFEGAFAIIAHEVGHHYCGHLRQPHGKSLELEADRFAGAALRRIGHDLRGLDGLIEMLSLRPSRSHPAGVERSQAITEGWNDPETAKACRS